MIAQRTFWLTRDQASAVPDGDPRAHWLLVRAGSEISREEAQRWGIADIVELPAAAPADEVEAKAIEAAPENKAIQAPPENKGSNPTGGITIRKRK